MKFRKWPLNQPLIAPNSYEKPTQHNQQGMSGLRPWEKAQATSLFLFFLSQQAEYRALIRINRPVACGKSHYTMPHWKKQHHFSPPAGSKAACETAEGTDEHHAPHATPHLPQENNPVQPLGRLKPPSKTEKYKQWTII
jgi:hypothetical protein